MNAILQERFGFPSFRRGQAETIQALLEQRAALAVFPTGAGKSLCYQLTALLIDGLTLVVSPLLALMKDQIDFLQRHNIPAARLDSSLSADEVRQITERVRSGEIKLLYVAPERFNNERFLAELGRIKIGLFAVDEAHCISEWGHNFRPDYLKLADIARDLKVERVLALTATATPSVVEDICRAFQIPAQGTVLTGFYRPNLELQVSPVDARERIGLLVQRLRERNPGTTIVYVTLQKTAEMVAARLVAEGLPAKAYHAGLESEERTTIQEWWMSAPGGIVVATIAFGMGIDKSDVRYVYHFNLPKSLEAYSQEIGRAGRDGEKSVVEVFACAADLPPLENFAYGDSPEPSALRDLVTSLLSGPETIDVAPYEWSARFDLRPLVLRTAFTYLELAGALKKGTPFYAGYEFRALRGIDAVLDAFSGEPGDFVRAIVQNAKRGRTWYGVDPETMAAKLGTERRRVIRALEVLGERGLIECRTSDLRDRYQRLAPVERAHELAAMLAKRFEERESGEIRRLQDVLRLFQAQECLTNRLVAYFGEIREAPCGHCSYCLTGRAAQIPDGAPDEPLTSVAPLGELNELADQHPVVLGTPRAQARFLCGLSTPGLSKTRLTRHRLFGAAESHRFSDVLAFVSPRAA